MILTGLILGNYYFLSLRFSQNFLKRFGNGRTQEGALLHQTSLSNPEVQSLNLNITRK